MPELETIVRDALAAAPGLDLTGCDYGPAHWDGPPPLETPPYYGLLAGLVRTRGVRRILELGTHAGGATLAMARGLPEAPDSRIVTVDVTAIANPALDADPRVTRIHGDAFAPATLARVSEALGGGSVDLLFIDIVHGYHQTKRALGVYANRFQPTLIALDDVTLSTPMLAVWTELADTCPSIECGGILGRPDIGFGLAMPPHPVHLSEGDAWRAALWSLRRALSSRLSYRFKARITRALERVPRGLRRHLDPS